LRTAEQASAARAVEIPASPAPVGASSSPTNGRVEQERASSPSELEFERTLVAVMSAAARRHGIEV
jgi:hypothetical protein